MKQTLHNDKVHQNVIDFNIWYKEVVNATEMLISYHKSARNTV